MNRSIDMNNSTKKWKNMVLSPHQMFHNQKRMTKYSQSKNDRFVVKKIGNWQQIIDDNINEHNSNNDDAMNRNEKLKANLMNYVRMNTGCPNK